jgi:hypothetical protein
MNQKPNSTKGTSPVTTLTPDQLAALLRASAAGFYADEAAVQLICGHRSLLGRADFVNACIEYDHDGTAPCAWIDWPAVVELSDNALLSGSEARILRLAAELAGREAGQPLAELLSSLDDHNARLVLDAITHALTHGGRR